MKKICVMAAAALSLITASAFAGTPNYVFNREITFSGIPRMSCAIATATGGIYYTDNNFDRIHYIANPLTASVAADIATVYDNATPPSPFGSGSFGGITIDPAGTIFASGSWTTPGNALARVTGAVGSWTTEYLTLPASITGRIGGCTAVGINRIVVTGYDTGSLHFLTISGSAVTQDAGSPVAAPGFSGVAGHAVYDAVNGKIFMSHAVSTVGNGGLYVFASNGTATGTVYTSAVNPFVADNTGESSSNSVQYQSVSVNSADQVVMTNRGSNSAGGNGWKLIDSSATGPNVAPYQFLDGSLTTSGQLPATDAALGHAFFTIGANKYLITSTEDATRKIHVYQQGVSAVSDWTLY